MIEVLLAGLAVAVGLVVLAVSADRFVAAAARLSVALRISPVVIGAVVIGFGTSAPELVVSVLAAVQGSLDIAVGNIIGSNVANLTLVLGIAALIAPIAVSSPTLRREAPMATGAVVLYAGLLLWGDGLGDVEGAVLAVATVAATVVMIRGGRDRDDVLGAQTAAFVDHGADAISVRRQALWCVVGLLGTVLGAQAVVWGARELAAFVGLGEGFVGFTLVAVGTSLPELVTSIQAARRDEPDLIVGNLLGSNMLNSLLVGGFTGILGADVLAEPGLAGVPNAAMVVIALVAGVMMLTRRHVDRWEGAVLLIAYLGLLPFLPR